MKTIAIFHNIRSSHNVGSFLRTADCAGIEKVYLTGYTPAPIDRFGREQSRIAKTALGAEKNVSWEQGDIFKTIEALRGGGHSIVGVEQTPTSKNYKTFKPEEKTVFIFGNEVEGIEEEVLKLCDEVVEIPIHGEKESLNVGVTAGIILFSYRD